VAVSRPGVKSARDYQVGQTVRVGTGRYAVEAIIEAVEGPGMVRVRFTTTGWSRSVGTWRIEGSGVPRPAARAKR
jgi:hypothetical protein